MEIVAGIALTLASFVLAMAIVRMLQNQLKEGQEMGLATWFMFGGVILFPVVGILAGIYLIFFH